MHTSQLCLFGRKPSQLFLGLLSIKCPGRSEQGLKSLMLDTSLSRMFSWWSDAFLFVCLFVWRFALSSERARLGSGTDIDVGLLSR